MLSDLCVGAAMVFPPRGLWASTPWYPLGVGQRAGSENSDRLLGERGYRVAVTDVVKEMEQKSPGPALECTVFALDGEHHEPRGGETNG